MSYDLTDLQKPDGSPGAGGGINTEIIIMRKEDVIHPLPARDADNLVIAGDIQMKAGKYMRVLYGTPKTIDFKHTVQGEEDGKGFAIGLELFHPGHYKAFETFLNNHLNDEFYTIIRECRTGTMRMAGTECSPMKIDTAESGYGKSTSERNGTTLTMKCEDAYRAAYYEGALELDPALDGSESA